ncbi:MAG: Tim44 domain-containing protein [Proteobacteria bacterium]|nr:Tim44 domain-containing protein [Pseudomonadota bacterium]
MDILFFAAIAFYVFWKLRDQFGKVDEEEVKKVKEKVSRKKEIIAAVQSQVIGLQKKIIEQTEAQNKINEQIISEVEFGSQDHFRKILASCNISAEFFLNGVKSAFEMTLKSFASEDLATLKILLSEKAFAGFEQEIKRRKAAEQKLVTNLISIDKAQIISASLLNNIAVVTISFVTKQINYITDKSEKIIEGQKDQIKELNDVWTFKKDISLTNKNWVVSAT